MTSGSNVLALSAAVESDVSALFGSGLFRLAECIGRLSAQAAYDLFCDFEYFLMEDIAGVPLCLIIKGFSGIDIDYLIVTKLDSFGIIVQ